jgi:arylsulfatase A
MRHAGRLLLAIAALLCCPGTASAADADEPPNFVIFLADDLGWGDLGCYGHERIKTPHLDRFASQGLRLTQCYSACSVCSPSRSAILTGRTPYRNGVFRWIPAGHECHLRTSEITIARLLKERGYATCHSGKWHLNGRFNQPDQPQPSDHGFDHWFSTQNNAAPSHKNPSNFVRNGTPAGKLEGFSAPLVVDEAIRWLKSRAKADAAAPFLLCVWTHEPHLPIEADPKFMEPYKDIADEGIRQHHGDVTQMDHAFGQLMAALDELKLAESTFVMFTSDNGPEGDGRTGRARGSTGGLRGRKRDTFEGGIRVPGVIRWPGHAKAGAVSAEPVIGSDLFTTICDIAGIPLPKDRTIDGASILPIFEGKPIARAQPLYWRNHLAAATHRVALRVGDWKIISSDGLTHFELYNLREDQRETRNLAAEHPDKFAELKAALIKHDRAVLAEGPDWWKKPQPEEKKKAKKK